MPCLFCSVKKQVVIAVDVWTLSITDAGQQKVPYYLAECHCMISRLVFGLQLGLLGPFFLTRL
jgi:hypothetical protein